MFGTFVGAALLILVFGVGVFGRGMFRVLFRPGSRKRGLKQALMALIGAPLVAIALLLTANQFDPQTPEIIAARQAESAASAAERAAAAAARAEAEQAARRERAEADRLAAEQADAGCRASLQCWGERHFVAAAVRCPREIERLARYSSEWTDGLLEPKFSHYRFSPMGDGIVVYIGDKVRFQNGFGAWQNMVYECTYDPARELVLDVAARPGRL